MSTLAIHLARRGHFFRRILGQLQASAGLRRQRARLAVLDDHILTDIGITRDEARHEASRPLWDAPPHWVQ